MTCKPHLWISLAMALAGVSGMASAQVAAPPVKVKKTQVEQMSNVVTPEERMEALRVQVLELQAQVETLAAQVRAVTPEPGDYYLSARHPGPGLRCSGFGLSPVNTILDATKFVSFQRFPDDLTYFQWLGCRRE